MARRASDDIATQLRQLELFKLLAIRCARWIGCGIVRRIDCVVSRTPEGGIIARELLLSQELPILLTNANNGQAKNWYLTANDRTRFEKTIRRLGLVRTPFTCPVIVRVTRLLTKRQRLWDVSSFFRGNYKQIEDACVACGWYHDDKPQWITDIRQRQIKDGRDKPAILIEVFKSAL